MAITTTAKEEEIGEEEGEEEVDISGDTESSSSDEVGVMILL